MAKKRKKVKAKKSKKTVKRAAPAKKKGLKKAKAAKKTVKKKRATKPAPSTLVPPPAGSGPVTPTFGGGDGQ